MIDSQTPPQLTFGSLFAGIGGLDLGLERAGMRCSWQVEIDDYATKVLEKHWPDVPKFRDVRSVGAHNLPAVDLICGGFPCQDISNAGRQAGITGERSGLWSEYARIIRELRPRYVLVENVAALLVRGMGTVLGDLAAIGYDTEWQCIPAAAVGAAHRRDRVYILAHARCQHEHTGRQFSAGELATNRTRQASELSGSREAIPHAHGARLAQRQSIFSNARKELTAFKRSCSTGTGVWSTEPNVGRVADGVPFGLEFLGGRIDEEGNHQKTDTATRFACWKVLRAVWEYRELAATSPYLHGERLRDIVPKLPCSGGFARWIAQAETDEELRHLWQSFYALSFEEAHDLQQTLLERARSEERRQTLALRKQRVNRLRGLGNAVVPQVAELIGRWIIEYEASL